MAGDRVLVASMVLVLVVSSLLLLVDDAMRSMMNVLLLLSPTLVVWCGVVVEFLVRGGALKTIAVEAGRVRGVDGVVERGVLGATGSRVRWPELATCDEPSMPDPTGALEGSRRRKGKELALHRSRSGG